MTLIVIPFLFLIRDRPVDPPSYVSTQDPERKNFCAALKEAIRDRNYALLLIIFSMVDGVFISFSDILSDIFNNYTSSQISVLGATTVIVGVVSSMTMGFVLKKTSKYLLVCRLVCFFTCVWIGTLTLTL